MSQGDHNDGDGGEFDQKLLTNVDKWWEFLDPVTYDIDESSHSRGTASATADQLDWTALKSTERRGPIGFGFFHRCSECGKSVPPDLTFCVHCGGQPRGMGPPSEYAVVIKEIAPGRRDDTIALLRRASGDVDVSELGKIADRPPIVFTLRARREQAATIVARMTDLGIYARSFSVDDPSVPWISETLESFLREPKRAFVAFLLLAGTFVGTVFLSVAVLFFGLIAFGFFFKMQMDWFRSRYQFSTWDLLNGLTGLDGGKAEEAAGLLRELRDEGVRGSLTVALMEYYTLHQSLQSQSEVYGPTIAGTLETLEELLDQILQACARFQRVERFLLQNRPGELEAKVASLQTELASATGDTAELLQKQLDAVTQQLATQQRLLEVRDEFRDRLRAMTRSLGALRARLETVRANVSARWEDIPLDQVLSELDDELVIFEETFESIENAAPAWTSGR